MQAGRPRAGAARVRTVPAGTYVKDPAASPPEGDGPGRDRSVTHVS